MDMREVTSMPSCGVPKKTTPYIARIRFRSSSFSDLDNDIKAYRIDTYFNTTSGKKNT